MRGFYIGFIRFVTVFAYGEHNKALTPRNTNTHVKNQRIRV